MVPVIEGIRQSLPGPQEYVKRRPLWAPLNVLGHWFLYLWGPGGSYQDQCADLIWNCGANTAEVRIMMHISTFCPCACWHHTGLAEAPDFY